MTCPRQGSQRFWVCHRSKMQTKTRSQIITTVFVSCTVQELSVGVVASFQSSLLLNLYIKAGSIGSCSLVETSILLINRNNK